MNSNNYTSLFLIVLVGGMFIIFGITNIRKYRKRLFETRGNNLVNYFGLISSGVIFISTVIIISYVLVSVQLGENSNWQVPKSLKNGEDKQYGNSGIGSKL